jgi:hypothetical protein
MNASEVRRIMHSLLGRELNTQQVEQLAQASVNRTVASGHALLSDCRSPRRTARADRPESARAVRAVERLARALSAP